MIIEKIERWSKYSKLFPEIDVAIQFLAAINEHTRLGRHDLKGEQIFAMMQKYTTSSAKNGAEYEVHRKYIDIQYMYSGIENILWSPLEDLNKLTREYSDTSDCAKYLVTNVDSTICMSAGRFAVFMPEDAHAPGYSVNKPASVTKCVIKVRI